jgi:GNAT superfamily N-acetyltransferase
MTSPALRLACPDDLEPLLAMQQQSVRQLASGCYAKAEIEAFLAQVGTMDPRLIWDGTYLVLEQEGRLIGCGGWTMRPAIYRPLLQDPPPPLAGRVGGLRSVFVAPDAARRGIGRVVVEAVEARLRQDGAELAEMLVLLCGMPLYEQLGYGCVSGHRLVFEGGLDMQVRRMVKPLPPVLAEPMAHTGPSTPRHAAW